MLYFISILTTATCLIYIYSPSLNIEPQAYTQKYMKLEGKLALNKDLDKSEILFEGKLHVPESLAYKDGILYTAPYADRKIVAIKNDEIWRTVAESSADPNSLGLPLGIRLYNDELYVADVQKGLLKVNIKSGKVTILVSSKQEIDGKTLHHPNDIDVADGMVYFSDCSTTWDSSNIAYGLMEHICSGRVYKYDIAAGKIEVALDNLCFPNGIQYTTDKKSVLISEFLNHRILRYFISGPKKGQVEVFAEVPGEPDNIRPSSSGGYWVAVLAVRDASSPSLGDRMGPYPTLTKVICKLTHTLGTALEFINQYISSPTIGNIATKLKSGWGVFFTLFNSGNSVVIEFDANGKVLRSLHGSNDTFGKVSQATEVDGYLYLGSYENSHILKLKL